MNDRPIIMSAPMVRALLEGRKTQTRRVISRIRTCAASPESRSVTLAADNAQRAFLDASGVRNVEGDIWSWTAKAFPWQAPSDRTHWLARLPYAIGDRLWVREAHYLTDDGEVEYPVFAADADAVRGHLETIERMRADPRLTQVVDHHAKLRPSIHMPRWASRMTLLVTDVRVQRLQEIAPADVTAEGVETAPHAAFDFVNRVHVPGYRYPNGGFGAFPGAHLTAFKMLWNSLHGPDAWEANPWVAALTFRTICANIDAPEAQTP